MERLKIEHLAPYLPYGLKIKTNNQIRTLSIEILTTTENKINNVLMGLGHKPILRPLSDLTKPYKNDATYAEFVGIRHIINDEVESEHYYYDGASRYVHIQHLTFSDFMILVENHFDVFGLIPNGLAIDINTL